MRLLTKALIGAFSFALVSTPVVAQEVIQFGVGLYQPDKDKNDATYTPLAQYLEKKLGKPVKLRTVSSWEGLAKSLANGETDIALMGPWDINVLQDCYMNDISTRCESMKHILITSLPYAYVFL